MFFKKLNMNRVVGLYRLKIPLVLFCSIITILIKTADSKGGIHIDSISHPDWKEKQVYLFRSDTASVKKQPIIFFCHGIGASNPDKYLQFISHITRQGFSVIYVPFKTNVAMLTPEKCYEMIMSGFIKGVTVWSELLDTLNIGVVGHSYGGGAVPGISRKMIVEHHWGTQTVFLYMMAPWYSHWIDQEQLRDFPNHPLLIVQCFAEDNINDPRMGIDIFKSIGIPDNQKGFIYLNSDTSCTPPLKAGHTVPEGKNSDDPEVNTLDAVGIYPFFDVLAASSVDSNCVEWKKLFTSSSPMKSLQIYSGDPNKKEEIRDMKSVPVLPEVSYVNFWHHIRNPRAHSVRGRDSKKKFAHSNAGTTLRNYISVLSYPIKKRNQIEDFRDEGNDDWDEKYEYRDSASYSKMICALENNRECGPMPIQEGYGARGAYNVTQRFVPHSGKGDRDIYINLPDSKGELFPVIFFAPHKNIDANNYRELLFHLASRGYIVVSSSFSHVPFIKEEEQLNVCNEGFDIGVELCLGLIDTSHIGFIGHGYGVRAIMYSAFEYLSKKNWGVKGAFLYCMSPDKIDSIDRANISRLPGVIETIVQVFDDDIKNDWEFAIDLFDVLPGKINNKRFFIGHSYRGNGCELEAEFSAPFCQERDEDLNGIDEYVIFRSIDILADHSFKNNKTAFEYAGFPEKATGTYTIKNNDLEWRAITFSNDPHTLPHRKFYESD